LQQHPTSLINSAIFTRRLSCFFSDEAADSLPVTRFLPRPTKAKEAEELQGF
jgi:hypothetical protein